MDNVDPMPCAIQPSDDLRPAPLREELPPAFTLSSWNGGRSVTYHRRPKGGFYDLGHVLAATNATRGIFERWWAVVTVDVEVEGNRFVFKVFAVLPKVDGLIDAVCVSVVEALEGFADAESVRLEWETV